MFADRLKTLRVSQNMTQEQLAERLGVVRKTVSDYENGKRYPKSQDTVTKLCRIFNVSRDYLMGDDDELVLSADGKYGRDAGEKARRIINETAALFAGGELSEEDKELVFRAISEVFWETRGGVK